MTAGGDPRAGSHQGTTSASPHTGGVPSEGTVQEWDDDQGVGVIDSADT